MVKRLDDEGLDTVTELTIRFLTSRRSLPPRGIVDVGVAGRALVGERQESHRLAFTGRKTPLFELVACGASDGSMSAQKLEAGILVVIEVERLLVETHGAVTDTAVARKLPQVGVPVAGCAKRLQWFVADRFRHAGRESILFQPMASDTIHLKVLSGKRVKRVIVIPRPSSEPFHAVTVRAVLIELPPMGVVLMAIAATRKSDALEALILVTLRARHTLVLATKRIARSFVIKRTHPPRARFMTSPAIGSQRWLVRVAVAVRTIRETDPLPLLVRMTALALQTPMGSLQGKRRPAVVESNLVELRIRRMTPLAILSQPSLVDVGMAGEATRVIE